MSAVHSDTAGNLYAEIKAWKTPAVDAREVWCEILAAVLLSWLSGPASAEPPGSSQES